MNDVGEEIRRTSSPTTCFCYTLVRCLIPWLVKFPGIFNKLMFLIRNIVFLYLSGLPFLHIHLNGGVYRLPSV